MSKTFPKNFDEILTLLQNLVYDKLDNGTCNCGIEFCSECVMEHECTILGAVFDSLKEKHDSLR